MKTWGADRLPIHRDSVALADSPAFLAQYPEFASYYEGDPAEPQHNDLENNIFCNTAHAFEKGVWADHFYNDTIECCANFFDGMSGNRMTNNRDLNLSVLERIPPTSEHELHFVDDAFNGISYSILDEKQTPATQR